MLERSFAWGQSALSGLVAAAIVLVLTLYLLLDGKSLYAWLLAFVPRSHREKLATTDGRGLRRGPRVRGRPAARGDAVRGLHGRAADAFSAFPRRCRWP